jgi:hypothetical protein
MRRHLWAMGLVLTSGLGFGAMAGLPAARGAERTVPEEPTTCGSYGTTVDFVESPKEAARKAGKLVFVLHVSGNFEDPRFT